MKKLLVMYSNSALVEKLFTTCVYLCYCKYLFFAHHISEYFSFSLFMLKANINLRKSGQLLKAIRSF